MISALWLDDLAATKAYGAIREGLEQAGLEVTAAADTESFEKEWARSTFELAIIDYNLPGGVSGVEVAQKLLTGGDTPILFLSEFTEQYEPSYRLDPRARYVTLIKPHEFEGWAERDLVPALDELDLASGQRWGAVDVGDAATVLGMSLTEIDGLPLDDQLAAIRASSQDLEVALGSAFSTTDVDWLVVVGDDGRIVRWGLLDQDPPSPDELQMLEKKHDHPAVVLHRLVEVNIIGESLSVWPSCSFSSDRQLRKLDRFPTLGLKVDGAELALHFDTGSIVSFVGYEDLRALEVVAPVDDRRAWYSMAVAVGPGGQPRTVSFARPDLTCEATADDGLVKIDFRPRMVRGWRGTSLARICPTGHCGQSELDPGRGYWCGSRRGLIGRDILRMNEIRVVLDAVRGMTYVMSDGEPFGDVAAIGSESAWEWIEIDEPGSDQSDS